MSSELGYRAAIAEFIRAEALPMDKFGHQPRLYALARTVAQGITFDDDIVYAAAWLHDLGVFHGHRPSDLTLLQNWDNTRYASEQAPEVLRRFGFPEAKIPGVVEAIRTHEAKQTPTTVEGTILRDADILEQLGAVGILRAVSKVGRDTRYRTFSDVLPVLKQASRQLPQALLLPRSRELAAEKIQLLEQFLAAVEREAIPALF